MSDYQQLLKILHIQRGCNALLAEQQRQDYARKQYEAEHSLVVEYGHKLPKAEANYRPGFSAARCGACDHFRSGGLCSIVEGDVREEDVCEEFTPRRESYSRKVATFRFWASGGNVLRSPADASEPVDVYDRHLGIWERRPETRQFSGNACEVTWQQARSILGTWVDLYAPARGMSRESTDIGMATAGMGDVSYGH